MLSQEASVNSPDLLSYHIESIFPVADQIGSDVIPMFLPELLVFETESTFNTQTVQEKKNNFLFTLKDVFRFSNNDTYSS